MEERLQKIMAQAGYGSRRSCEELIEAGRVLVNGKRAELGTKADPTQDSIQIDGRRIEQREELVYIALNKPRGVLSDVDPNDPRPTVRGLIPVEGHLFAIGRLDLNSEGLILMTNDGMLANKLTHPRYGHEKEYKVLVATRPDDEQLQTWRRGVVLEDGYRTAPAQVDVQSLAGKGTWLRVVLREGRKRQIREVGRRIGLPVAKILRVRIGTVQLGGLKSGEWRYLTAQEVESLKEAHRNRAKVRPLPESRPMSARRPGPSGRPQRKSSGGGKPDRGNETGSGAPSRVRRPGGFTRGGMNRSNRLGAPGRGGDTDRGGEESRGGAAGRGMDGGSVEVNRGGFDRPGGAGRGRSKPRGQGSNRANGKSLGVGTNRGEGAGRGTGRPSSKRSGPPGRGAGRGGPQRGGSKPGGSAGKGGFNRGPSNRGGDAVSGGADRGESNRGGERGGDRRGSSAERPAAADRGTPAARPAHPTRSAPFARQPRPPRKPRSS
jgi:23S rRNA pseudouridine2605 synthase